MKVSSTGVPHKLLFMFVGLAGCWSTAARGADYYLDPNYTGVNGAAYNGYVGAYNSISAALAGMPAGVSASNPNRLLIAPGTYNVGTTSLSDSRSNIDLIGLDGNSSDVVITSTLDSAYNTGSSTIGTTGSATLQLKGNNQAAANITFANSTDTPYIVNSGHQAVSPTGSYVTGQAQTANAPAVALLLQGDGQAFNNCQFLGYQDTLYTKGGRAYFNNCTVSGDVDFIFANGTDVFNNSTINMDGDHSGGTVTAASTDKRTSNGIVFLNSVITGNSVRGNSAIDIMNAANANGPAAGSMYLGRPWGYQQTGGDASTVFINTEMSPAINSAGFELWLSTEPNPGGDSRYAEYNSMDLSGNPQNTAGRVSWEHIMTAAEAAAYTVNNLFSFESAFPWYGYGYPAGDSSSPGTGSANPSSSNFSYPAFWGDRNAQNQTNNSIVTGNPTSYSDPSWTQTSLTTFDPTIQLATTVVPEPASLSLVWVGGALLLNRRTRNTRASGPPTRLADECDSEQEG